MEGTMGTTIEMGMKTAPVAARENAPKQAGETPVSKKEETVSKENRDESKDSKQADKQEKTNKPEEQEVEPDAFQELTDKIREHVDKFGDHLDKDTKQELIDSYLSEIFDKDKKKDKEEKLVDSLAEMVRMLMLLMKLLMLASKPNTTGKYSGKELGLSDVPPEGNNPNPLTKLLNGEDSRESWMKFKGEVEKIENVPFAELMSHVLEANSRYSVKQFTLKKSKNETKGVFGKNNLEMFKQRSRAAKAYVSYGRKS